MITSLKDEGGRIIAYCEWRLLGPSGLEVPSGEYIWINDCWVHKEYRMTNRINLIIDKIMALVPTARYGYFQRKAKNDKVRIFTREQFQRRRMSYDPLITGEL